MAIFENEAQTPAISKAIEQAETDAEMQMRSLEIALQKAIRNAQEMLVQIEKAKAGEPSMVWSHGSTFGSEIKSAETAQTRLQVLSEQYRMFLGLDRRIVAETE